MIVINYKSEWWSLHMSEMISSIEEEIKKKKKKKGQRRKERRNLPHIQVFCSDN